MRFWTHGPALVPAFHRACGLGVTVALGVACNATVTSSGPPPPPPGQAILDWTINGTKDPGQCQLSGADTFHVALTDSAGGSAGEFVQDCTAFATTIGGLAPDTYTGKADLLDSGGAARTTQVDLAPFDVAGATTVTVSVEFPSSSFF